MTETKMVRLGDVCDIIAGTNLDRSLLNEEQEGIPVVLLNDLEEGDTSSYYTGEYSEAQLVDTGDYLVSMSDNLNVEQWLGSRSLYSHHLCRLEPDTEKLSPSYMYHALRYIFSKLEDDEDADLVVNNISIDELKDTVIPLPDLEAQNRIADVLFYANELVELQLEQISKSHQLLQSRFTELFGDIEENTKGWEIKPLSTFAERLKSRSLLAKDRRAGSYPYYDATGVVDQVDEYLFDEDLLLVAKVGPVLTSDEYPVAMVTHGKVWASDLVHVLRLNNEVIPEYVAMVINSLDMETRLRGGIVPKLPSAALNELPIPLAPIELQIEYKAFLNMVEEQIERMGERLEDVARICNGLNHRYFESTMIYE